LAAAGLAKQSGAGRQNRLAAMKSVNEQFFSLRCCFFPFPHLLRLR
jgi:hypothetical protein